MSPEELTDDLKLAIRVAAELFDHSYRIKQYLTRIGPGESQEHQRLVETLVRLLGDVERKTISSFAALWDTPLEDDSRDHAVELLQDNLRRFSRYFTTIHELLAYLPRESIGPEIVFTLEGCFPKSYRPPRVSVVLGSIVNAFEFDFIEILEETLGDIGDVISAEQRVFVLQLAICHANSPLAYAILGHEVGHAVDVEHNISSTALDEFLTDPNIDPAFREMLENWSSELCADLVASRAIGPGPILSLLSMEYCICPEYVISMHSDTHPSTRTRLEVVCEDMADSGAPALIASEVELYKTAYNLDLEKEFPNVQERKLQSDIHDMIARDFILPIAKHIRNKLSSVNLRLPRLQFDKASLDRCVSRLEDGSPVSAQGQDPDALVCKVNDYRDKSKSFRSDEQRRRAFEKLCGEFVEAPVDIPKILLSGYRRRSEIIGGLYNDCESRDNTGWPLASEDNVTELCKSLAGLDRLIGSSIATTRVHQEVLRRLRKNKRRRRHT